jgi:NADPH2:quinone reductase
MTTVIRMHATGGPEVLVPEQETVGAPGPGQLRLNQAAIGVNFVDTMFRAGIFPPALPFVTGVQAAGTVTELGAGVTGFSLGDRVAYFFAPGAYAAERLVDAAALLRLPDDLPLDVAAGMLTKGITAWLAVRHLHDVRPGDTVLVQGATGGVGSMVTRWAKALGARVVAVGSAAKLPIIAAEVDHALASDAPALADRLRTVLPSGADIVYEFIGQATFDASVEAVRDGGRILAIGAASGAPKIDRAILKARSVTLTQTSAAATVTGPLLQQAAAELFARWREGIFGEIELQRYPLDDAARAHRDIAARRIGQNPILVP